MQEQRGNFLLQVLLALTLVFAFMPFIANRLASRDMSAKMYAAKTSVESLHNAARIYARENKNHFVCASENNPTTYDGVNLVQELSPYGLPNGFNPVTALNQNLSLQIVHKMREGCNDTENKTTVDIIVSRGDLSQYQLAELARMIGFFARVEGDVIRVNVPVDVIYSDIVRRRETNEQIGFLTDLEMGGCNDIGDNPSACNSIHNINTLVAERGNLNRAKIKMLTLLGDGLNSNQNFIKEIYAESFNFKGVGNAAALNVRGDVTVDVANLQGIGTYLKPDKLSESEETQYEEALVENHNMVVNGDTELKKGLGFYVKYARQDINLPERLNYGTFDAGGGGSAGGDETPRTMLTVDNNFNFFGGSISNFDTVKAENIFVYPNGAANLADFASADKGWGLSATKFLIPGVVIVDQYLTKDSKVEYDRSVAKIAPGGESVFEDVSFVLPESVQQSYSVTGRIGESFLMGALRIPKNPAEIMHNNTNFVSCHDVLDSLFVGFSGENSAYDNYSLMQNILCQYVYLARLERYVNCVMCCRDAGNSYCSSVCSGNICNALDELNTGVDPW